ncbi:SIR2 family protein [Pseudomonas sp. 10S4]|uniref:SIR2 family protein n=1 Tax=Pseudomonas sp. 10S4 TaxID=3048583 RepID=UPI002AC8F648|nr:MULTISPECIES: SIR2 family protein [unclassified Pseudomonas]MEB0222892.1 SIR2 family protein [Pseudomonas sp. 5S1]MEB0293063.1 SIR2 family protein [Pseudomonas sp. 10S4]WPX17195.1 SIR2 family protein [Pseudomonas sp. 10S4]
MTAANRKHFLKEFPKALNDGNGAVFVGAGVSMAAGYPSWAKLLREIGQELGVDSTDVQDLTALAQWSIQDNDASRVQNVILNEISPNKDIPPVVRILARLPLRHIWTTNYDRLIERAFEEIKRPLHAISKGQELARRLPMPGAARLYKMHGCVTAPSEVVISTDHYERYGRERGQFLPLFQAHLTGMSMLFIGLSFTDPNIKHVLSLIRDSFTDAPPEHFAIVRPPHRDDFRSAKEHKARLTQHTLWAKDLRRYGLRVVEVDTYDEIPELMEQIERRLSARRIWVSGSWPVDSDSADSSNIYKFSEKLGKAIAENQRDLVTGAGLLVGSASLQGFVAALRHGAEWDINQRLTARPFPQPIKGQPPKREEWTKLRQELARLAGVIIFVGGLKMKDGELVLADGMLEELEFARQQGAFLLPIGATKGVAEEIYKRLKGSDIPVKGKKVQRPTDAELDSLANHELLLGEDNHETLLKRVFKIIDRVYSDD